MKQNVCFIIVVIFATIVGNSESLLLTRAISGITKLLYQYVKQLATEPSDTLFVRKEYDFIVVGAGAAGCVLANRLTENPAWDVLLLEAGGTENYYFDIPGVVQYLQFTSGNWKYETEPSENGQYCNSLTGKRCKWPRGKVVGGSSALNYMVTTRGTPKDYDEWSELGNDGWSYEDVLPYFKKIEHFVVNGSYIDESIHGYDGHVTVSYTNSESKIAQRFVKASEEYGFEYIDYNSANQIGVSRVQTSTSGGIRESSSRAYLHPIRDRENVHLKKLSMVTKILIDPHTKEAYGVEYENAGKMYRVKARKEVIISAGAINSPQLLMLSGIGPEEHLRNHSIPVLKNAPVGENLMDHTATAGVIFTINQTDSWEFNIGSLVDYFDDYKGLISTPGGVELLVYSDFEHLKNVGDSQYQPEIELLIQGSSFAQFQGVAEAYGMPVATIHELYDDIRRKPAFMSLPIVMKPKSRGKILLKDRNYLSKPLIYPNYYDDLYDLDVAVKGMQLSVNISNQPSLQAVDAKLYDKPLPACSAFTFASYEYFECLSKHLTFTFYHPCGTCKMGPDSDEKSVVDTELKVRGIRNLRVVDASIMPVIPRAHLNFPTMMIAEKAADLIKKLYQ